MCRPETIRAVAVASLLVVFGWAARAQSTAIDWRHIGNSAIELSLPSVATGAVDRVWYSGDGSTLYARTVSGRIFQTSDYEAWKRVDKVALPAQQNPLTNRLPEAGLKVSSQALRSNRFYAVGSQAYRSDDGGLSWSNLTAYKGISILGEGLSDVAISPQDPDEVVVASAHGVWRSIDGGISWTGVNEFLPNLPSGRLLGVPSGTRGVRLSMANGEMEAEWAPGEKSSWKLSGGADAKQEQMLKLALSEVVNRAVTAVATSKDYIYAGDSEGRLQVSSDDGTSWGILSRAADGPVQAIWVDPNDPRIAVAVFGARPTNAPSQARAAYVARTMNGGIFWDDITANLPQTAAAHGVAADRASGAIYVATDAGVFYMLTELGSAGRPTNWNSLAGNLPAAPATDVKLDSGANQIYIALEGYGVYAALAPHRLFDTRIVSAADYTARAAAPGALLSVLGSRVESARSANTVVPVLDASDVASQIQVPFEAEGNSLSLSLERAGGRLTVGLPLKSVSPAIFVDPEGTPLIMDAASGILLDANKPAHSNTLVQVLATGFGRVTPDWPTGLAAPLADPPHVAATVHAFLDGAPVEVTQASLAPGYVGFYLIELRVPRMINAGPSELVLEAKGQQSNRVRIYVEP